MKLEFRIEKIKANPSLASKFDNLRRDPFIQRIHAKVSFIKADGSDLLPIKAIVDTGAVISLFPQKILKYFPDIKTEDHTLWGIVDSPECHLSSKLTSLNVKLIDRNGKRSKPINIIGAFSSNVKIPILLGRKDLLGTFDSSLFVKKQIFVLEID